MRANDAATLASSIYIVARKETQQPTGFYNDVRAELTQHLDTKLHRLWEEGIGGADFFIAAIGSAIEVFGKYEQIMDFEGNIVRANRLLEEVRAIATNYAVKQILHDDFATEVSPIRVSMFSGGGTMAKRLSHLMKPTNSHIRAVWICPCSLARMASSTRKKSLRVCSVRKAENSTISTIPRYD